MYICMYVCMYVCMYACIYIDTMAAYNTALLLLYLNFTNFLQAIIKRDVFYDHTAQARPL